MQWKRYVVVTKLPTQGRNGNHKVEPNRDAVDQVREPTERQLYREVLPQTNATIVASAVENVSWSVPYCCYLK